MKTNSHTPFSSTPFETSHGLGKPKPDFSATGVRKWIFDFSRPKVKFQIGQTMHGYANDYAREAGKAGFRDESQPLAIQFYHVPGLGLFSFNIGRIGGTCGYSFRGWNRSTKRLSRAMRRKMRVRLAELENRVSPAVLPLP